MIMLIMIKVKLLRGKGKGKSLIKILNSKDPTAELVILLTTWGKVRKSSLKYE
jgi:hypothetical protein